MSWQVPQFSCTVKACLALWQAPQDLPFSMSPMVATGFFPGAKILLWQALQEYLATCALWLKATSPATFTLYFTVRVGWQRLQSATAKAALPLWQAPHDLPFSISFMLTDLVSPEGKILLWQSLQL